MYGGRFWDLSVHFSKFPADLPPRWDLLGLVGVSHELRIDVFHAAFHHLQSLSMQRWDPWCWGGSSYIIYIYKNTQKKMQQSGKVVSTETILFRSFFGNIVFLSFIGGHFDSQKCGHSMP
jgi:hypothetical protein